MFILVFDTESSWGFSFRMWILIRIFYLVTARLSNNCTIPPRVHKHYCGVVLEEELHIMYRCTGYYGNGRGIINLL